MRYSLLYFIFASLVWSPIFSAEPAKELVGRLSNLANPAAVERLKLSPEVKAKIDKIIDERETSAFAVDLAQSLRSLDPEKTAKLAEYRAESEKLGLALLTAEQLKMLEQWEYDLRGPMAFQDRDLADLLKITSEQQAKMATAIKDFEANVPTANRKGRQPELERQLIGQLTPEQKTAWGKLIGRSIGAYGSATAATEPAPAKPLDITPTKSAAQTTVTKADTKEPETEPKTSETKQPETSPATAKAETPESRCGSSRGKEAPFQFQIPTVARSDRMVC